MKRLFIATQICLNQSYLDLIGGLRKECSYDDIVWVNNDLQHLTLRFLGATSEIRIPLLMEMLDEVASVTEPFKMKMNKLGVFGSRYSPSVIWLGFEEFEGYRKLFEKVEENLEKMDFEPNHGNFVPHITLGRIKKIDNKKRFWEIIEKSQPVNFQIIDINEISLIQSHLTTQGPIYKTLRNFSLKRE
jgi:RNA 2',3'-cyclic 3'-phosphodiesterase